MASDGRHDPGGFCGGIGLCVAGTIVVSVWQDRIQSTMLVVQDATFNVAGVVFPLITTFAPDAQYVVELQLSERRYGGLTTLGVVALTRFTACETAPTADRTDKVKSGGNPGSSAEALACS